MSSYHPSVLCVCVSDRVGRDGAACRQSAHALIKESLSVQLSFSDIRMELHPTECQFPCVRARSELIQSVYRCVRIADHLRHMKYTVSHAVCLPVRRNLSVSKSIHSLNAEKSKRNEMWREVGLAEGFLFCDSDFVTSLTNAYLSLV